MQELPLSFCVHNNSNFSRAATLSLPHGDVSTPVFMPVGTYGAIKGVPSKEMENLGFEIILGNAYHLHSTPGDNIIKECGGLHRFTSFNSNFLTDSGGYQMVSLLPFSKVEEKGVRFKNPKNGVETLLTPEKSIEIQRNIGADIIMALDDVVTSLSDDIKRIEEACHRTVRWLDRCIKEHNTKFTQNLFGIVQGGLDFNLRDFCLKELIKRDLPGYAIGGLSGGENKDKFWKIVLHCTKALPKNKPIYLMGVGYPIDLVVCTALGVDMFDCVFPTRAARTGKLFTEKGEIKITQSKYKFDLNPIDKNCKCKTCSFYTRAYLHTIATKNFSVCSLFTIHNLFFIKNLMDNMRNSIMKNEFEPFVKIFVNKFYYLKNVPNWVKNALKVAGIDLLSD